MSVEWSDYFSCSWLVQGVGWLCVHVDSILASRLLFSGVSLDSFSHRAFMLLILYLLHEYCFRELFPTHLLIRGSGFGVDSDVI